MKRSLIAAAVGFVAGYAYAFVSCLVASKGIGIRRPAPELTGEDMHDVLPTDDEVCAARFGHTGVCDMPKGHPPIAEAMGWLHSETLRSS